MHFFHDWEFYEDGERVIPMAVGIVAADGREFYRVCADWLSNAAALAGIRRHRFLMTEVVPHLPELARQVVYGERAISDGWLATNPLILPRWRLQLELADFIGSYGAKRSMHELWAYYGAYDHLALSQTFGTMMQLPESVPMFTRELMQLEADVNARRQHYGLDPVDRPAKEDEHHALADARWDLAFYKALTEGDVTGDRLAWMIDTERDLVTVPSRVFVAGYERLTSEGPNEGLDYCDEEPARRLWNALL